MPMLLKYHFFGRSSKNFNVFFSLRQHFTHLKNHSLCEKYCPLKKYTLIDRMILMFFENLAEPIIISWNIYSICMHKRYNSIFYKLYQGINSCSFCLSAKDESVPPMAVGFGCGQPCGAPQQCFPSCSSSCCGGGSSFGQPPMISQQQYGAPMPPMGGMPMAGPQMPFPPGPGMQMGGAGQCPGQCPSSCAPSCQQSCCGGAGQQNPMMG